MRLAPLRSTRSSTHAPRDKARGSPFPAARQVGSHPLGPSCSSRQPLRRSELELSEQGMGIQPTTTWPLSFRSHASSRRGHASWRRISLWITLLQSEARVTPATMNRVVHVPRIARRVTIHKHIGLWKMSRGSQGTIRGVSIITPPLLHRRPSSKQAGRRRADAAEFPHPRPCTA